MGVRGGCLWKLLKRICWEREKNDENAAIIILYEEWEIINQKYPKGVEGDIQAINNLKFTHHIELISTANNN